ncbi:MAG: prolyl oligopeptidase family serine peptidase [Acidobacteriota bacterium]
MNFLCRIVVVLSLSTGLAFAQTDEIAPGDNLVIEGIPKLPAALAAEVDRYQSRTATLLDWHPIRREMLIRTRFGDTAQVHLVQFPGGARKQLTFFADSIASSSYHPKKADYFIFDRDSGGNGLVQIYRYDFSSSDITLLTDGKSRNVDSIWSNAGDKIVIAPLNNAHKITKPLFILVGKNDPNTPPSESEQMLAQVKKNSTPIWYMMANDKGHGYTRRKNLDFATYATILFVKQYLLQ